MDRIVQRLAPALVAIFALTNAAAAETRDRLHIVGSSTVFPYTDVVADNLAADGRFPRPDIESTGTGGGFKLFCAGSGIDTPDITGASRPMTRAEWELCRANGVWPISQFPIGYDGLTVAISRFSPDEFALTLRDLYSALAARVPIDGQLSDNPYKLWADIRPELPNVPIRVIGPPRSSGTRDSFVELALHRGCNQYAALASLQATDPDEWTKVCSEIRTDGAYIEAGEDDEVVVADIEKDPHTLGIMGYGYLFEHEATLRAAFVQEYVRGMNPAGGYLFTYGLVPYFEHVNFEQVAGDAVDNKPMNPPAH